MTRSDRGASTEGTGLVGVTGATGRLGGRVARLLAEAGVAQRLVVRDRSRAPALDGAEVAEAAFGDSAEARSALEGVSTLLLVSAAESADRLQQQIGMIDAAAAAGVRHVVYTSFVGAGPDATFTLARTHGATEDHLRASGMATTVLRDNFYLDVLPLFADDEGVLRGPAGHGRVAAVAVADIARVAAAVLQDPGAHRGAVHDLTGPQSLTLHEVAATIAAVSGRPVRYEPETVEEAYASRRPLSDEQWQLDAWVSTYTAIASGELSQVTSTVEDLTGAPATTLEQLLVT